MSKFENMTEFDWRPTNPDLDYGWISQMRYDEEIRLNVHTIEKYTEKECHEWLTNLPNNSQRVVIELIGGVVPIGLFRIDKIDLQNQNCYFGLDILKDHRGKGYAKRIWKIMMNEWFFNRNMNMIYLEVLSKNQYAKRIYSDLGFEISGTFPNKVFRDGQWIDSIIMSMSREDYFTKNFDDVGSRLIQTK